MLDVLQRPNYISLTLLCGGLTLAGCQMPTKWLCHSPSINNTGEKNTMKSSWVEVRTGRSLTYCHRQNGLDLGKLVWFIASLNQNKIMRNKDKSKKTSSSWAQLYSWYFYLLPSSGAGGWGLRSVHHTLSLPLLPPQGEDSSHSAPAPVWGLSHGR